MSEEIDWEAAKSGKRLLRHCDEVGRYVGPIAADKHVVAFADGQGGEYIEVYRSDGSHHAGWRLIQEPEVIEFKRWVNVYHDLTGLLHRTEANARAYADSRAIAIAVPITITKCGDKIVIHGESE